MPGYDLKIIGEYPRIESLRCSSCELILKDAIQTLEEGLRFCKSCWEESISSLKAQKLGIDPTGSTLPDKAVRREIDRLPVLCENYENGCDWTGKLRDHEYNHKANCEYKTQKCTLGCGKKILLRKLRKHEQEECPFRITERYALGYDTIKKWFNDKEEGWIDLTLTRVHMVGPAGSGKTCAQNLLLNEPPPQHLESIPCLTLSDLINHRTSSDISPSSDVSLSFDISLSSDISLPSDISPSPDPCTSSDTSTTSIPPSGHVDTHTSFDSIAPGVQRNTAASFFSKSITNSTPIACKAVKAIRIASDDNETWKRITRADLLERLSSSLKKAAAKFSQQKQVTCISPPPSSTESGSGTNVSNKQVSNEKVSNEEASNEEVLEEVTPEAPQPIDHGVVVKEIVEYISVAKAQLSEKWAYIIDSGGQPAFQELLPVFTRAASLNIITLDLSKGIDEEFEYTYRINGQEFKCDEKMKYSNRELFNSIVSAASVQKTLNIPYVTKPVIQSMSFVLGTHYDVVIRNSSNDEKEAKEKIKKMSDELMSQQDSHSKGYIIQDIHEDSVIFPVNTLLSNADERKTISQKLFKKISGCNETSLTVKLPIRLFVFELCLEEKSKAKGGFVTKEEAVEEGARLHMNHDLVEAALVYFHNCTIILYYPNIIPQLVFVDPQRILDVLSQLLALTYFDKDTAQSFVPEIIQEEMTTLKDRGCFTEDLLEKFTANAVFTGKFQPKYFINLLKNCHIIAELQKDISQAGDIEYFLPSALPSYNGTFEKSPTDRKPLLYVWRKQKERIAAKKFVNVPQGIFPLMIVRLLNQEDYVVQLSNPASHKVTQFRDAVSLLVSCDKNDTDPHERLYIINRKKHIEVIFTGKKERCPKINALVHKVINESANDINISVEDLNIAFACQREATKYCVVKNEADREIACYECFHTCTLDDSYWCWFNTSGSAQQHISDTEGSGSSRCKPRPVDEKIDGKCKELSMKTVTKIFAPFAHHYKLIGIGLGVTVNDLKSTEETIDNLIKVFERWFDANKRISWDTLKELCEDYPKQLGKAKDNLYKELGIQF